VLSCAIIFATRRAKQIIFSFGYHENPKDQKFDPPDSQTINKKTVKPIIQKYLQSSNWILLLMRSIRIGTNCWPVFRSKTSNHHCGSNVNIWNAYQCMITFKYVPFGFAI